MESGTGVWEDRCESCTKPCLEDDKVLSPWDEFYNNSIPLRVCPDCAAKEQRVVNLIAQARAREQEREAEEE